MPSDTSARLSLPYLAAGQLQKHVTLNQALTRLDALTQTAVVSRTTLAQPTSPANGDLYILPPGATGSDWSTRAVGDLMRADVGGWTRIAPVEGMIVLVLTPPEAIVRRVGAWTPLPVDPASAAQNLTRLGLNTAADATNPFSAKLNKALWTALEAGSGGDGDLRMTLNKEGAADVLSILLQSGYGARAEFGLIGDDDFRLKVSADGSTWHEAMAVEAATGRVRFDRGAVRAETTTLTFGTTYAVPAWARRLEVVAVGGAGGGGSGATGTSGNRFGGGGGGAGGISVARWDVAALATSLSIVVGAGGAGGIGSGTNGAAGQISSIASGGTVILTGNGGQGGRGGSNVSGQGGLGGTGVPSSNAGGDASVAVTGAAGMSLTRADGAGGGGGGGGLDASGNARSGGPGGAGSVLGRSANGGGGGTGTPGGAGGGAADLGLGASGGGGGGGANAAGSGHAGGAGTTGSGGGGSGAGTTGAGSGGAGGAGYVRITAIG